MYTNDETAGVTIKSCRVDNIDVGLMRAQRNRIVEHLMDRSNPIDEEVLDGVVNILDALLDDADDWDPAVLDCVTDGIARDIVVGLRGKSDNPMVQEVIDAATDDLP